MSDVILHPVDNPEPTKCPTRCDSACEARCHEGHQVTWKRTHDPHECPGTYAWTPVTCPHCNGTGAAPGDGRTRCGFCDEGQLTRAMRKEFERAWGPVLRP